METFPPRQKTPFRVIQFGVGGMGSNHLEQLLKLDEVEIVGLCDIRAEALDEALKKVGHPVKTSTDPLTFAEEAACDYAVVVVPNPVRLDLVQRLLARKIPIFMEKPAAHRLEDLEQMLEWQRKAGVPVMVGQNYRFAPAPRIIKQLIEAGEIGELLEIHGRFQRCHFMAEKFYYGKLPDILPFRVEMVIHHMDLITFWLNCPATKIIADGFRTPISWGVGQMGCDILARFENGARLNYHGDWSIATNLTSFDGHWVICGSQGVIRWEDGPVVLKRRHPNRFNGDHGEEILITPETNGPNSLRIEHQEFIAAIQEGRQPESSLEENAHSLRLCLEAASQNMLT